MKEFYSSGISYLDGLMGGVLLGDNVVWVLGPGTYFDYFLECFLTVKEDNPFKNIYVSFDFPPQKIYTRYKESFDKEDFILVDAFTFGKAKGDEFFQSFYKSETTGSESFRIHCIKDLSDPTEFIKVIRELQNEFKEGSLCKYAFDSLTGMQELWGEKETLHFFTYTCPKLFELKALAYWPLAKDAHSKAFLANISHITQLVINLDSQGDSTCTAGFLKMDGRPSQLLNGVHYYNFKDNKINFLEPSEQEDERRFKTYGLSYQGRDSERIPSFLRNKDRINIGSRIKDFRLKKNISQVELARILNITPSALSQIESNQSLPSLQLFVDIARCLEKSLDSFFIDSPAPLKSQRQNRREKG
ncbi:MAG: helix-turn-helix transcriptional regulator [Thermodesulfobacteriota bacterium]